MAGLKKGGRLSEIERRLRRTGVCAKRCGPGRSLELVHRVTDTVHNAKAGARSYGDERMAPDSVHNLFAITRGTLKTQGRKPGKFAKIAIVVLNQVVRPFTAKWHKP